MAWLGQPSGTIQPACLQGKPVQAKNQMVGVRKSLLCLSFHSPILRTLSSLPTLPSHRLFPGLIGRPKRDFVLRHWHLFSNIKGKCIPATPFSPSHILSPIQSLHSNAPTSLLATTRLKKNTGLKRIETLKIRRRKGTLAIYFSVLTSTLAHSSDFLYSFWICQRRRVFRAFSVRSRLVLLGPHSSHLPFTKSCQQAA